LIHYSYETCSPGPSNPLSHLRRASLHVSSIETGGALILPLALLTLATETTAMATSCCARILAHPRRNVDILVRSLKQRWVLNMQMQEEREHRGCRLARVVFRVTASSR